MRFEILLILCLAGCGERDGLRDVAGSIDALPGRVIAESGEVTLFADYGDAQDGHVSLYVVNRTERSVGIATQYGRPFFKLEARNEGGSWERAQGHRYAGPSLVTAKYYPVQVPAGTFRVFDGLFPEQGESRPVRFREYRYRPEQGLVSNVGQGRVTLADIQRVKGDRMMAHYGSEEEVVAIAVGDVAPVDDYGSVRVVAIGTLERFKNRRVASVLTRLLDDEDPSVVREAVDVLDAFDGLARPAHPRLLQLIESSDTRIRRAAVAASGRLRIDGSFPYLLPRLGDEDAGVRRNAAAALAMLGNRAAIPHLENLLEDPDRRVRDKAAWAIEAIRAR